ncbi:MAG: S41 family peptidase [Candidatus Staskawiczbacteria bacterium]|nr:S41 family peptidase [Candidatus Staskawiczbacteria bacterium]
MNKSYKKVIWSAVLVIAFAGIFCLGAWVGVNKIAYHVPQPGTIDFSLFWDAYNKLQKNFITPSKIDEQKIIYGAIDGMTRSLGDPYTNFFDPEQAKRFQQDLNGSFDGIGVEVGIKKDLLTVIAPLKGTPGQKAGLKSGDIILKINGQDATNLATDEAVSLIRGPRGTTVTLNIFRDGWETAKDIKIIRDTIKVPSIEWSLLASPGEAGGKDGDTAYIQIYQFDGPLTADFKKAAFEILQSPAKRIVLDLRDNPGGYLSAAQDVAGWFLQKGQPVAIEDFGNAKPQQTYKTEGSSAFASYPMVILINQGSASASEILAGALRDNRNIKLVGTKSFGKGCVQQVLDLRGGSFLKITVANWLTPKGNSISDVGLTPDVKVDITDQDALVQPQKDAQLDKALEIVKDLK